MKSMGGGAILRRPIAGTLILIVRSMRFTDELSYIQSNVKYSTSRRKKTRLLTFKTRLKPILFGTGLLYTIRSNDDETVCTTAESMLFATYFELLAFSWLLLLFLLEFVFKIRRLYNLVSINGYSQFGSNNLKKKHRPSTVDALSGDLAAPHL